MPPEPVFLLQHAQRLAQIAALQSEFDAQDAFGRQALAGLQPAVGDEGAQLRQCRLARQLRIRGIRTLCRRAGIVEHGQNGLYWFANRGLISID